MKNVCVIIAAAGSGTRAHLGKNKLLFDIGGMTLLERTLSVFLAREDTAQIVIAASKDDFDTIKAIADNLQKDIPITVCDGGANRTESVHNALGSVDGAAKLVAVHDGARPFVSNELLDKVYLIANLRGAAIPVLPIGDTVKQIQARVIVLTPNRDNFVFAQTPQVFHLDKLKKAYESLFPNGATVRSDCGGGYTDDAAVYQNFIGEVFTVSGEEGNIKLTTRADFNAFFPEKFIIGTGFDTHRLEAGRKLILGGVQIPHEKGLMGHSDADVLAHAVMDAMLSAVNIGDIGTLFPDTDPAYEGADSFSLLAQVRELVKKEGFEVNNLSAVVIAQKPKLSPYITAIRTRFAEALGVPLNMVALSATTNEGVGLVGQEAAIAAKATVSMVKL